MDHSNDVDMAVFTPLIETLYTRQSDETVWFELLRLGSRKIVRQR